LAVLVATMALLASFVAVAIGWSDSGGASAGGSTEAAPSTASVSLKDFAIQPESVTVAEHGTLHVTNSGAIEHNLAVRDEDVATSMLAAGSMEDLSVDGLAAGSYTLFCEVPGHEAAGMTARLQVGGATEPASAGGGGDDATSTGTAGIDFTAAPGPDWHPYDPVLQPAPGATVHDITLHATEEQMEVAPGVTQLLWTFGGTVPGPVLRGHVGDVFNVTLVNDGTMGHSIDFHASEVAPNVAMRTIRPGESLVYQFTAEHAGIWMYHCGTPPALHHIGNGMFGAVVIDPPGLPAVDHEYMIVQSELYLGAEAAPGDLAKMVADEPDAVVFNGYVNQYQAAPIRVEPGETVRVWVLDAGPNENSAFHIVGTVFDTVYKEGAYLLRPDGTSGGSQVLDLQPAQGGFVEFTLAEPGLYPMVTHKFANVGKGALGLLQAGEVAGTMAH
jgi:nitrite reductase (NO-forming)